METDMRPPAVDYLRHPSITRRSFLQAAGLAMAARFTAIADELARLFRWCSLDIGPAAVGAT